MTHDVSFTASRFEHMPPAAVALAVLLHVGVGLALFWISPLRPVDHFEDAIEVSMEAPEAPPVVAEKPPEPAAQPAASSPPPAPAPTPQPPQAPPMRLGLPPPAAERSTDPRDVAGAEKPAPRATDMPTPDKMQEAGPKNEPKPEEPKQEAAKEEPKPQPPEPPPQQQALAQPEPPAPPQQQAVARPEPPAPPPSLEQALPPLEAPPPPVTERDIPKPIPAPPPPRPPQQAARPAPPPPPPPAPRPQTPPAPPQQLRPSPLGQQQQQRSSQGSQAAAQPSPTFRNPADNYGEKRAQEQYLWQVMRRIAQFPYVPKNTGVIREEGTVLTRVTISRQGQLLNVVMEKSSGLPSLDAGVMDTIRRASPYPALPAEINGDSHTFLLPVSFRYNEQR